MWVGSFGHMILGLRQPKMVRQQSTLHRSSGYIVEPRPYIGITRYTFRCASRICVRMGGGEGERDFADITQRSRGGGKNVGLKNWGSGGGGGLALDPHLAI